MKKLLLLCLLTFSLTWPALADEKIDPAAFICAELVALPTTTGEPSLFEALQIDGYASAAMGNTVADPQIMAPLLEQVYLACQTEPTEKVLTFWQETRKTMPNTDESPWRADKTTCGDYSANEEDGSGFVIWLDGYNRQKSGKPASVLESDATLNAFLKSCADQPKTLL
ncbi:MAG: hypothetical protein LBN28_04350, partial [Desulfovibrio sp.]|nr:hypothetical protein [Desulfovibrio sp.]